MDKNNIDNIFVNYHIDWITSNWLKDLLDQNNLDLEDLDLIFGGLPKEKTETPNRAPILNEQNGK